MSATESRAAELVDEYLAAHDGWTSDEFEAKATRLARKAELDEPINRAPSSVAAGAIYAAGLLVNEKLTQEQVSAASGVTEVTISSTYREIIEAEGYRVEPSASHDAATTVPDEDPIAEAARAKAKRRFRAIKRLFRGRKR